MSCLFDFILQMISIVTDDDAFKKVQDLYKYITPSPRSIICFILYLFGVWYRFSKLSFAATEDVFFFFFFGSSCFGLH